MAAATAPDGIAGKGPDWPGLMETARGRAGFFTSTEALAHRISAQLLRARVTRGWVTHEMRGVYRFASTPPTEHDELIALWLWSGEQGVFSHVTALSLYHLSDALPAKIHMTVPPSWRYARFAKPGHLVLHIAELAPDETQWFGHLRVTTVERTLADCIEARISTTFIEQGLAQARMRRLISPGAQTRLRRRYKETTG